MARAFVGLGSNLDPERHIREALRLLRQRVTLVALSTLYRTPALDRPEQPDFINGVAEIRADLSPRTLKEEVLREIEAALGRVRGEDRFAPRTMDLDLLVYDDLEMQEEDLVLPDPEILNRPFLAHSLAELAPDLVLPGQRAALRELAASVPKKGMQPLPEYTDRVRNEVWHES